MSDEGQERPGQVGQTPAKELMTRSGDGEEKPGEVEVDSHTCSPLEFVTLRSGALRSRPSTTPALIPQPEALTPRSLESPYSTRRRLAAVNHLRMLPSIPCRSHGRCVLAKTSQLVNSKSSGSLSLYVRSSASVPHHPRERRRLGEQQPDVERKPDQMTLGVSFHYGDGRESTAESVAIPPVCKRKSVLLPLFFTPVPSPFSSSSSSSLSSFSCSPSPGRSSSLFLLSEIFTALQGNLLFVSNIFIISLFVVITAFVPDEETNPVRPVLEATSISRAGNFSKVHKTPRKSRIFSELRRPRVPGHRSAGDIDISFDYELCVYVCESSKLNKLNVRRNKQTRSPSRAKTPRSLSPLIYIPYITFQLSQDTLQFLIS